LNSHRFNDVTQIEILVAEQLVTDCCPSEIELANAKMKKHKSPGNEQVPAECIRIGGKILWSVTYKLITSIWIKKELNDKRKSIIVPNYKESEYM
jgi:hypothetical protein